MSDKSQVLKDAEEVFGEEAKSSGEWEEVVDVIGDDWKPNEGDVLEGVYIQKKEDVGVNHSKVYEIQMSGEEAQVISVWGSTVLDSKMTKVTIGEEVKITFVGMETPKSGGKDYKLFKVQHRVAPMAEV